MKAQSEKCGHSIARYNIFKRVWASVMVPLINSVEFSLAWDMEQSSRITARFLTRRCDFCRTNVDAALPVRWEEGRQIATGDVEENKHRVPAAAFRE